MVMPMIGIVIQCQGWLMPGSDSFGRTSQPQVSLASAAICVALDPFERLEREARRVAARIAVPASGLSFASIWPVRTIT